MDAKTMLRRVDGERCIRVSGVKIQTPFQPGQIVGVPTLICLDNGPGYMSPLTRIL